MKMDTVGLLKPYTVYTQDEYDRLTGKLTPLDTDKQAQQEWEDFVNPEPRDFVNPDHYKAAGIECIEYQRATSTPEEFQGYLKNCCVKYLHRMRTKDNPLKNLLKAQWYLNRLVEEFKKQ